MIPNFLTNEECNMLLSKYIQSLTLKKAKVSSNRHNNKNPNNSIRNSSVGWITDIDFLNTRLTETLKKLYNINGWLVSGFGKYQFTEYKTGGFYNWHTDTDDGIYKSRFASIVIQLNDTYTGGKLEIKNSKNELIAIEQNIGNLYVFNSNLLHRVSTVESGTRYSLVNWISLNKVESNNKTLI